MKSLNPLKFLGSVLLILSFIFINQNFQAQKKTGENIDSFHNTPLNKENSSINVNPVKEISGSLKESSIGSGETEKNTVPIVNDRQFNKHEFNVKREHVIKKPVSLTFGPMNNVVSKNYDFEKVIEIAKEYNLSDEMIEEFGIWVDALSKVFVSQSLLNRTCNDVLRNFENQIIDQNDLFSVLNFSHIEREKALIKVFISNHGVMSALLNESDPNNILK